MELRYKYNHEKNALLLAERNIGFEEIIQAISDGNLLSITNHPNKNKYPHQMILNVRILEEVYIVPFVKEEDDSLFLKTLFPSRKARKLFFNAASS